MSTATFVGLLPREDSLTALPPFWTAQASVVEQWRRSAGERRRGPRQPGCWSACIIPRGGSETVCCVCDSVGAGGLHVIVPIGYGVAVGQRCEIIVGDETSASAAGAPSVLEGHYARVVHTDLRVGRDGDFVGVGLKFERSVAR